MNELDLMNDMKILKETCNRILGYLNPELMSLKSLSWDIGAEQAKLATLIETRKETERENERMTERIKLAEQKCHEKCNELEELKRRELTELRRKQTELDLLLDSAKKKDHERKRQLVNA